MSRLVLQLVVGYKVITFGTTTGCIFRDFGGGAVLEGQRER